MRFDRYLRFYNQAENLLEFGRAWGVYEFPDGQNQIWFASRHEATRAKVCLNHPAILDLVSQIPDAIGPISLMVTYLYGARSDKSTSGTRVVCNVAAKTRSMLEQVARSRELTILAPHDSNDLASEICLEVELSQYDGIVFPDASAKARLRWLMNSGREEIVFEKERDQQTGEIVGLKPVTGLRAGRYLVADDICDGGATFVQVAQKLPACKVDLAVTHGIFSGGALDRLCAAGYGQIWTTNSFVQHLIEDEAEIRRRCNVQNVW